MHDTPDENKYAEHEDVFLSNLMMMFKKELPKAIFDSFDGDSHSLVIMKNLQVFARIVNEQASLLIYKKGKTIKWSWDHRPQMTVRFRAFLPNNVVLSCQAQRFIEAERFDE